MTTVIVPPPRPPAKPLATTIEQQLADAIGSIATPASIVASRWHERESASPLPTRYVAP